MSEIWTAVVPSSRAGRLRIAKRCRTISISLGSTSAPYHPIGAATAPIAPRPPSRNCLLVGANLPRGACWAPACHDLAFDEGEQLSSEPAAAEFDRVRLNSVSVP